MRSSTSFFGEVTRGTIAQFFENGVDLPGTRACANDPAFRYVTSEVREEQKAIIITSTRQRYGWSDKRCILGHALTTHRAKRLKSFLFLGFVDFSCLNAARRRRLLNPMLAFDNKKVGWR